MTGLCLPRDGRLRVGDEIINVNGRRLRGVCLEEARRVLRHTPMEVDIVVAREPDLHAHESLYSDFDVASLASGRVDSRVDMRIESRVESTVEEEEGDDDGDDDCTCSHYGDDDDDLRLPPCCHSDVRDLAYLPDLTHTRASLRELPNPPSSRRDPRICSRELPDLPELRPSSLGCARDTVDTAKEPRCCSLQLAGDKDVQRRHGEARKSGLAAAREEGVVTAVMVRTVSDASSGEWVPFLGLIFHFSDREQPLQDEGLANKQVLIEYKPFLNFFHLVCFIFNCVGFGKLYVNN